jgi:hypothetical protein
VSATPPPQGVIEPATLLRLIEDSGHGPAVIEQAVQLLRRGLAQVDLADPALVEVLRCHLLSVGSPTDVTKYFSLELLERASPARAIDVSIELTELLARSALLHERGYHVERAVIRSLGERKVARALPALALLASRCVPPISRTAARAVVAIVGTAERDAIAARLADLPALTGLPEGTAAKELAQGVARALAEEMRRSTRGSDPQKRRAGTSALPPEDSDRFLRPEPKRARQARLRATLRAAARDPARCGNCDTAGKTLIVHVVPPPRGGTDRAGNLVALCHDCRRKLPRRVRQAETAPPPGAPQLSLFQ